MYNPHLFSVQAPPLFSSGDVKITNGVQLIMTQIQTCWSIIIGMIMEGKLYVARPGILCTVSSHIHTLHQK